MNYTSLRATATSLLTKMGRTASLTKVAASYDPTTGASTDVETSYSVKVVVKPVMRGGGPSRFSDEAIEHFQEIVLIQAGVAVPEINDFLTYDSKRMRVLDVSPLSPAGVDIFYEAGVAGA